MKGGDNMKFDIDVYTTHITVSNGTEASELLEPLINRLTFEDSYAPADGEVLKVRGYIFDEDHDLIYFHSGVDIDYLRRLLKNIKVIIHEPDEYEEMEFDFEEVIPPRDKLQEDIIDFFIGRRAHADNAKRKQLLLPAGTGTGKTFTSSYAACSIGIKTIIIVHRGNLIKQWGNTLVNMHGMPSKRIRLLSTQDLYDAALDRHQFDADVYILTHQTFRFAMKAINDFRLCGQIFKHLKIGLKIIDECHLEFANIILIDMLSNVHRNFYLSATPERSNKDEQSIYKYVFSNTLYYRQSAASKEAGIPNKWVSYNTVVLDSQLKPNIYRYKVDRGRSMNAISYGKFVIKGDKKQTHFKCVRDILKDVFKKDEHSKVIIFLPLIDLTEEMQFFLSTKLCYDDEFPYDLSIKTMTSKNSAREKELAKKADVIITTIQSCGTGTDLPGLTCLICCSPFASKVTAEQVFGRLRYCGKLCYYYDIIDKSVPADTYFWKARTKVFHRLALEVHTFDFTPDDVE